MYAVAHVSIHIAYAIILALGPYTNLHTHRWDEVESCTLVFEE